MEKEFFSTHTQPKRDSHYTDLAIERRAVESDIPGIEYSQRETYIGKWEEVQVRSEEAAKSLGRPQGIYSTLSLPKMHLLSEEEIYDAADLVARELCGICDRLEIIPDRILAVGLGNKKLTPDTVGTKSADLIKPTLQIRDEDEDRFDILECSEISVICPGVTSETGLEALEIVKGVTRRTLPSLVIAIDSIVTRSPERLGSTIQISDTGICPGSGVGIRRKAINRDSVGCPVISIGIPTVIDSRSFSGCEDIDAMLVSPREIDEITSNGAKILSYAINQAFGIF